MPTDTTLNEFPEKGKPPLRLPDPGAAQRLYSSLLDADEQGAYNRSRIQAMFDGEAPYSKAALSRAGSAFRFNLNFGDGAAMLRASISAYADLVDSVEVLGRPQLPPAQFDPSERTEIEDIVAEEFHQMVRHEWPDFDKNWDLLAKQFVGHGVGIAYFPQFDDWKWKTGGWDNFLIPRDTEATEEAVEILIAPRVFLPHELYRCIQDEAVAKSAGWDVEAVKEELMQATKRERVRGVPRPTDWAELQKRLKNNDLDISYGGATQIQAAHFWFREFDGSYSHYIKAIGSDSKTAESKFLFKKTQVFSAATDGFVLFTSDVGNGTYHSIRGLGYDIFASVQSMNRMWCGALDNAMLSSTLLLQPRDNADLDQPPITLNGSVGVLNADFEVAQTALTNRSQSLIELNRELSMMLQNNTGTYRARAVASLGQERTRYEVMAQQEQESRLNSSQVNLFYRSWGKLLNSAFKRVLGMNPETTQHREVKAFYDRCFERGVPPEIVRMCRRMVPERAVGLGSPSQRQLAFQELTEMAGTFDEKGKENLIRDRIANRMGRAAADRYRPKQSDRPVIDTKIAELENGTMHGGGEVNVMPGENHAVHLPIHLDEMFKSLDVLEQMRENSADPNVEEMIPHLQFIALALQHCQPHLQALGSDPIHQGDYASAKQALQQLDAEWMTYMRQVQRVNRRDQQEQGAEGQPDPKQQEHQMKLQFMWEQHQLKMQARVEDVQQKMELRKVQADQKMATQIRLENQKRLAGLNKPAS